MKAQDDVLGAGDDKTQEGLPWSRSLYERMAPTTLPGHLR